MYDNLRRKSKLIHKYKKQLVLLWSNWQFIFSQQPCRDVSDKACSPLRDKAGDEELARVVATLEAKHREHLEQVQNILLYRCG
jgi:hypothetical protein